MLTVFSCRINPLAKPPLTRFVWAAGIVVAQQAVKLFSFVSLSSCELMHDLLTFRVVRWGLAS